MHPRRPSRNAEITRMLAVEAARIMAEQSIHEFTTAKRKAAERLRIRDPKLLPDNIEIEAALLEHRRLFHQDHQGVLHELRACTLKLMQLLHAYQPHLVGSVLSGSADQYSEICLHVFSDDPEAIVLHLLEHHIDAQHAEKKIHYSSDRIVTLPCFKFIAGKHPIELVVFTAHGLRQAPLNPVDHRPMPRANVQIVQNLLK